MITLTREEAQQVLDAFLGIGQDAADAMDGDAFIRCCVAGRILRARLSAPEPTLVLWNVKSNRLASPSDDRAQVFAIRKLEWRGLTDQEVGGIMEDLNAYGTRLDEFARAIEAKLKEKNT
jgi:hypothetical protein